jgi:hypothetical protein
MVKEDINSEMTRDPFVPFRVHLRDGRKISVPFPEIAHLFNWGMLVFIGMKKGTRTAKSYDRFPYDHIVKIEKLRPPRTGQRRKKAS